jgi:hypothetical protein
MNLIVENVDSHTHVDPNIDINVEMPDFKIGRSLSVRIDSHISVTEKNSVKFSSVPDCEEQASHLQTRVCPKTEGW